MVEKIEEKQAVGMSCWKLGVGWVGGGGEHSFIHPSTHPPTYRQRSEGKREGEVDRGNEEEETA